MRILIADDDRAAQRILAEHLAQLGHEICIAGDGTEALALLMESPPQLAIVDWMMPGLDGTQLCRILRTGPAEFYVYVILLTAKDSPVDLIEGLDAGADVYMTKPVKLPELEARLRSGQRIVALQEQLIGAREQLRRQATRDALTGLWNRGAIFDLARGEILRTERVSSPLAVLLCDVDHFKLLNDTYGHPAGDTALREVAQRIRAAVRAYDLVGRYGGEEFLVVLPGMDEAQAAEIAERIRGAVCATPVHLADNSCTITISIGTAVRSPGTALGVDELVYRADERLLSAKRQGRNRVVSGAHEMPISTAQTGTGAGSSAPWELSPSPCDSLSGL